MKQGIDMNCLVGTWPFRKLSKGTAADLAAAHRENGIIGGYVASLNSIFYNDPFEAEEELHAALQGTPYHQVMGINPLLPGYEKDIKRGVEKFGIRGVRIYPGYHEYTLDSDVVDRLFCVLEEYDLPLFVSARMEDERLNYLFLPRPIGTEEIQKFLKRASKKTSIILLSLKTDEILACKEEILSHGNTCADISWLRSPFSCVSNVVQGIGKENMVLGTMYPLLTMKSTCLMLEQSSLPEQDKSDIYGANAVKFMERSSAG